MTKLDEQIAGALRHLAESGGEPFDISAYMAAFEASAQKKAADVLERLQSSPFAGRRPVFVSIGGGDGAEINHLLRNSSAHVGILVEAVRPLADAARKRSAELTGGRTVKVIDGDAQEKLQEAMEEAYAAVRNGQAEYVAVTCHAVLHELYDRSHDEFDADGFLARVFGNPDISTWFSYREPGVPEGWPNTVRVRAKCSPQSLLRLSEQVAKRHPSIDKLRPVPQIIGEYVRLHRTAAMELIVKLFYIDDLQHEINERSTSVLHSELMSRLHLAIGLDTVRAGRGIVLQSLAPTDSFNRHWTDAGIEVLGDHEHGSHSHLGVPPSQARIVAWRYPEGFAPAASGAKPLADATVGTMDLELASEALRTNDTALLNALLISRGRAWIELQDKSEAVALLKQIWQAADPESFLALWSGYLLSLAQFFADHTQAFPLFSEDAYPVALRAGLGPLFAAERMEGYRKRGDYNQAIAVANQITAEMREIADPEKRSPLDRYVEGTSRFLVANFLRQGGQYAPARSLIENAQQLLNTAVPSHATELRHCQYALQVCASMLGDPGCEANIQPATAGADRFAEGLLQLTYAHAAWAVKRYDDAIRFVGTAITEFEHVEAARYVKRARQTKILLIAWRDLSQSQALAAEAQDAEFHRVISLLTSQSVPNAVDMGWLLGWLSMQRPSRVLGLLQFTKTFGIIWERPVEFAVPRTVEPAEGGTWQWTPSATAKSLKEADALLRTKMAIAPDRHLPLLAD